jgi:hypothetical protein
MKIFKTIASISVSLILVFSIQEIASAQNSTTSEQTQSSNEGSKNTDFQKLLDESKGNQAPQSSLKDDVEVKVIENPKNAQELKETQKNSQEKTESPNYPKTSKEILVFSSIGALFLILNFLGSSFLPRYRYLFIATPFDLGVKEIKTDAQVAVKGKRIFIETMLLISIIGIFIFFDLYFGYKGGPEENLIVAANWGLSVTAFCYVFYIIARLIKGFSSRCSSCKNMFAVSTNTHKEPSSTYTKSIDLGVNGSRNEVFEVGMNVSNHHCNVCNNNWTTKSRYETRISGGPGQY